LNDLRRSVAMMLRLAGFGLFVVRRAHASGRRIRKVPVLRVDHARGVVLDALLGAVTALF